MYLLSDAAQIEMWPTVKKHLTAGKALYFSHGFGITYKERTGIIPPTDVDVILTAPKGSGTSLASFVSGRKRIELILCHFSGCNRKSLQQNHCIRHRYWFWLFI
jgi:ketol-acid reductoisomerase